MASSRARSATPISLGGECHRHVVEDPAPERGLVPGGSERHDAGSRRGRGGQPCGSGRACGTASARPAGSRRNERTPSSPRADHDRPVGGVTVEHERLVPAQHPVRPPAAGAGADGGERVAVTHLVERDGPPLCSRRPGPAGGRRPRGRRAARVAITAEEKKGPGRGTRPICSSTMQVSSSPAPAPPCARGRACPVHPRSTSGSQSSGVNPPGSSASARSRAPSTAARSA